MRRQKGKNYPRSRNAPRRKNGPPRRNSSPRRNGPSRRNGPRRRDSGRSWKTSHMQGPFRPQAGILELHREGYGFLRADTHTFKPRPLQDALVPSRMIRRHGLRPGSYVEGEASVEKKKGLHVLSKIYTVDGLSPEAAPQRVKFEKLQPADPSHKFNLENEASDLSLRVLDLITPVGKGQRCLIISPPRAGKTTLLQKIANSLSENHPEIILMAVLVDERPEEVTDWRRSTKANVIHSCADESPANHVRVNELAVARAKRLVESGKDVAILMDSLTRLGRAYNLNVRETGRTLSGGLDASVLDKPKAFLGAARAIENGGSLTIVSTCLVDTGSRLDQVIYEEFKGTGNMECILSTELADIGIFPAIDIKVSGTRKEEKLRNEKDLKQSWTLRRVLQTLDLKRGVETFYKKLKKTRNNAEFFASFSPAEMERKR